MSLTNAQKQEAWRKRQAAKFIRLEEQAINSAALAKHGQDWLEAAMAQYNAGSVEKLDEGLKRVWQILEGIKTGSEVPAIPNPKERNSK